MAEGKHSESQFNKKVCILGDFSVGKTSLVRRFIEGIFSEKYLSTIGVKVDRKEVTVPYKGEPAHLTMLVWDLAGSEKFTQARANYLRGAAGAILVCDLTRPATLEGLSGYITDLHQLSPTAKLLLAANKLDLVEAQQTTFPQVAATANHFRLPFFLTSAKTGTAVELMFQHLGQMLLE